MPSIIEASAEDLELILESFGLNILELLKDPNLERSDFFETLLTKLTDNEARVVDSLMQHPEITAMTSKFDSHPTNGLVAAVARIFSEIAYLEHHKNTENACHKEEDEIHDHHLLSPEETCQTFLVLEEHCNYLMKLQGEVAIMNCPPNEDL